MSKENKNDNWIDEDFSLPDAETQFIDDPWSTAQPPLKSPDNPSHAATSPQTKTLKHIPSVNSGIFVPKPKLIQPFRGNDFGSDDGNTGRAIGDPVTEPTILSPRPRIDDSLSTKRQYPPRSKIFNPTVHSDINRPANIITDDLNTNRIVPKAMRPKKARSEFSSTNRGRI